MSEGSQRLSIAQLREWEQLGYGMFIHFGLSTFVGSELPSGQDPIELYNPSALDVEQWVSVARDAGMKYAVLTTKHVAGHCLWQSKFTDYHVGNSPNQTDVLEKFVNACEKKGVMPGFYYCSWDNHHKFNSLTPSDVNPAEWFTKQLAFTTYEYQEFQYNQITEILSNYGKIGEVWVDIPAVLPRCYREKLYRHIATMQPEAVVMMNNGFGDGSEYPHEKVWPADLIAIERWLPNSMAGHVQWREIEGKQYYMPGEVCDPIGKEWFFVDGDLPRSDYELLGMYTVSRSRGANLLLDVPPDKSGTIPQCHIDALMRLRANIEKIGGFI
jgi:alpha-L-fucosidase